MQPQPRRQHYWMEPLRRGITPINRPDVVRRQASLSEEDVDVMRRRTLWFTLIVTGWLIGASLGAFASAPDSARITAAMHADDPRLEKKVTLSIKQTTIGELVERLAAETGIGISTRE